MNNSMKKTIGPWTSVFVFSLLSPLFFVPFLYIEVLIYSFINPPGKALLMNSYEQFIYNFQWSITTAWDRFFWTYIVFTFLRPFTFLLVVVPIIYIVQWVLIKLNLRKHWFIIISLISSGLAFYIYRLIFHIIINEPIY